jgi:hypothetical protein
LEIADLMNAPEGVLFQQASHIARLVLFAGQGGYNIWPAAVCLYVEISLSPSRRKAF